SPAPPRRSLHPAPPATARSTPSSAAGPVRSSPENWPTPGCHPCLRCDRVSPRRFSFSMRMVPPDFTNRAGEPSLKPPTELETPSFANHVASSWSEPRFKFVLAFPVFHPFDNRAKRSSLLAPESEAIDARTVVHGEDVALGHSQPAKVNPTLHGIATLVEELSWLRSQRKQ